jgi:hypothetical protein
VSEFLSAIFAGLLGFFCGALSVLQTHDALIERRSAIEQCQASLPRDKTCEIVITAKVKGE